MLLSVFIFAVVCTDYIPSVIGHANMVMPYNWFDDKSWIKTEEGYKYERAGMKSGLQCYPGCTLPPKTLCPENPKGCVFPDLPAGVGCSCMWYKNGTHINKPTLFDPNLLTYPHTAHPRYRLHNPWRSPGTAPTDSPCGVVGGNINGCKGGCMHYAGGFANGVKAELYPFKYTPFVTNWTRGDVAEVAWAIFANHGGGYSYRICKKPEEGFEALTEECFQQTPLNFVGDTQWVQYGEDISTREGFPAVRTTTGTFPEGSQWTKNPVPACNGGDGGFFNPTAECPSGTQFPPPRPGIYGFGVNRYHTVKHFQFSIIDRVRIPKDLEAGDYVLSFRWDTEQTAQVWNTCASLFLA